MNNDNSSNYGNILSTPPRSQQIRKQHQQSRYHSCWTGPRTRLTPSETPFLTPIKSYHGSTTIANRTGSEQRVTPTATYSSVSFEHRLSVRRKIHHASNNNYTTITNTNSSSNNDSSDVIGNRSTRTTPDRQYHVSSSSISKSNKRKSLLGSTPFYTPRQGTTPDKYSNSQNNDDRFIPSRKHLNMDLCRRALLVNGSDEEQNKKRTQTTTSSDESNTNGATTATATTVGQETPIQKEFKRRMLSTLCNIPLYKLDEDANPTSMLTFGTRSAQETSANIAAQSSSSCGSENVDPYSTNRNNIVNPFCLDTLRTSKLGYSTSNTSIDPDIDPSVSGLSGAVANKRIRKVPNAPVRILDAPDIVDDYYLNLISWSKDGILAVALARSVYLWNSKSGAIHHLVTVDGVDYITSVSWCCEPGQTNYIAVGTHLHSVHIYDGIALAKIRTMDGATGRIASLSWNTAHHFVSAGDRDACIVNHDMRSNDHIVSKYRGHLQEVCGLKWNDDGTCLASGGNENYLCLWDVSISNRTNPRPISDIGSMSGIPPHLPRLILKQHKAAVKALDWCPFHRGLLASGGGTADRSIKFWNTTSGAMLNTIDTGSQVCSLIWNRNHHYSREICSSHGYSENQLILWKYPTMTKIKELTGHTARVLNMDISPDGKSVVSAGADETLRFWNIFDTYTSSSSSLSSSLSSSTSSISSSLSAVFDGSSGANGKGIVELAFSGRTIR